MGSWGVGSFDNDTALDWVFELEKTDDLSLVEQTIELAASSKFVEVDVAEEALIAIETIARILGRFGKENPYSEDLDRWVNAHSDLKVSNQLVAKAIHVLEKIKSDESELYTLWKETEDFNAWIEEVNDLKNRLL